MYKYKKAMFMKHCPFFHHLNYLNNIEAWWIQKYIHDYGRENVMNITTPKITMEDLIKEFDMQVIGQMRFAEVENG